MKTVAIRVAAAAVLAAATFQAFAAVPILPIQPVPSKGGPSIPPPLCPSHGCGGGVPTLR